MTRSRKISDGSFFRVHACLLATIFLSPQLSLSAGPAEKIDPAEVQRKIDSLAVPDETAPYDQRPINWLAQRRNQILPQLIAALDSKQPRVAQECLLILKNVSPSKELTDALIAKASDEQSPLRYEALLQLEPSAADPRVIKLFDQVSVQDQKFPDRLARARWAWLAGHKDRAVEILRPCFDESAKERWETYKVIRLLGEIREPGSVKLLEPIAAGNHWEMAAEAYLALSKIDPEHHGLTENQKRLMKEWRSFKEECKHFKQRMDNLAKLNFEELRPYVMQMLRNEDYNAPRAALWILAAWKDKTALPQIRDLLYRKRLFWTRDAVAAYLTIENSPRTRQDVLNMLDKIGHFASEDILRGIVEAEIPLKSKVALLRAVGDRIKSPQAIANSLWIQQNGDSNCRDIIIPLMDSETDLQALGRYCELAAKDPEKQMGPQVRRAMQRLTNDPKIDALPGPTRSILNAVAVYELKDLAPDVKKLMASRNPIIRAAAQATGAKLGIPGAMQKLVAQLSSEDQNTRKSAAEALCNLMPTDEAERAAREEAALAHLGKPSEDYALRILATCGREKTAKALEPILDDPNVLRAVYAAWVLAQLPDKTASQKGLRRVAIFGLFHHNSYQAGDGIDFTMAPDLRFHQVTMRLNPDPKMYSHGEGPVRIPQPWLVPFPWDDAEQQYAIRSYRLTEGGSEGYQQIRSNVDFLYYWPPNSTTMDQTHLPLLKEMATHDSHIHRVIVQGQRVAHFYIRQIAAQRIAAITKEKATYLGLNGETLDSAAYPQPYKDQNQLLARYIVDRVQNARLSDKPQSSDQWDRIGAYAALVRHLKEQFGAEVFEAIRREGERRNIDVAKLLPPKNS